MSLEALLRCDIRESPVLVEIPHAGTLLCDLQPNWIGLTRERVLRDSDPFVDQLATRVPEVGVSLIVAQLSRYVVDLNRAAEDVDTESMHSASRFAGVGQAKRGVVWCRTIPGDFVLERPLTDEEFETRISRFHAPYHREVERLVHANRARFGRALLLATHSMPSSGRSLSGVWSRRADVVLGTRNVSTTAPHYLRLVEQGFRSAGLSVRHDDPYAGGFTTAHYGRPQENLHAIQIEFNRDLYLDENSLRLKVPHVVRLQAVLAEVCQVLDAELRR